MTFGWEAAGEVFKPWLGAEKGPSVTVCRDTRAKVASCAANFWSLFSTLRFEKILS